MFKNLSTSLIVRGVLAVIVGIIAITWPGITVLVLVIVFAIYAFMDAGLQAARAFTAAPPGRSSATCCLAWSTSPPDAHRAGRRDHVVHGVAERLRGDVRVARVGDEPRVAGVAGRVVPGNHGVDD
jgi:hypothetical protein